MTSNNAAARFLSFMIIRTLGPNSVNRDDQGNFKTTWFGGVERRRISSQCVKRAMRKALNKILDISNYRTKELPRLIKGDLEKSGITDIKEIVDRLAKIFSKKNKEGEMLEKYKKLKKELEKDNPSLEDFPFRTSVSIFLSEDEKALVTEEAKKNLDEIRPLDEIVKGSEKRYGAAIALFGRFMAEATSMNLEASVSAAHEISTHEVMSESDYFIVENELGTSAGGGYLDHSSYGCATTYLHVVLDLETLKSNLPGFSDEQIKQIVGGFAEALAKHFPQGSQHPFFAQTLPDYIRVDTTPHPITMAGAFEVPIQAIENRGLTSPSIKVLEDHREKQIERGYEVVDSYGGTNYTIADLKEFVASQC